MDKKYFTLEKNVFFGLAYIFPILSIILLATEKELMLYERRMCVDTLILAIFAIVLPIVGIVAVVFAVIAAVKRFQGDFSYEVPIICKISEVIVKE